MKTKKIIAMLLSTLMLGSLITHHARETKVEAAEGETWTIIGKGASLGEWGTDHLLTFDSVKEKYVITLDLDVGDVFKFRKDYDWVVQVPAGSGQPTGFNASGGDIRCNDAGRWILGLNVGTSSLSNKATGFDYAEKITVERFTVTYYNDDELLGTDTGIAEGTQYTPKHYNVDEKYLEGWYSNSDLTEKFVKGTPIVDNTDLFGNYLEAEVQGVYVKKNTTWTTVNVYMWNEDFASYNNTWPGKQMNPVSGTSNIYYYELPLGSNFNKLIINNGTNQTTNLELTFEDNLIYDLAANLSVTKYETFANIVVLAGDTIATLETQCFGYQGGVASETGVYYIHLDNGTVVAELTEDREAMVGAIRAYILANTENACDIDGEYLLILEGLLGELTINELLTITDAVDRVAYLKTIVDAREEGESNPLKGINTILNSNNKTALYAIMIIGIMGLISITGYYFFIKKRYSN